MYKGLKRIYIHIHVRVRVPTTPRDSPRLPADVVALAVAAAVAVGELDAYY